MTHMNGETAYRLIGILETGQVHGWEDLSRLSGIPEADLQWTCRRLSLDHGFPALGIDRIMEAFEFADRHNPLPTRTATRRTHTMRPPSVSSFDTSSTGFMRSGVKA